MRFLINPSEGENMAKRRRDSKGRFLPKRKSRRSNPSRARARNQPRDRFGRFVSKGGSRSRRSRRRKNPATGIPGFPGFLMDGAVGAGTLTGAKVATRAVPGFVGQSRISNVGLGIQLAAAVALGWITDMAVGGDWGTWVLAGGLSAPLEDAAVRQGVPFLAPNLTPGAGTVGRYPERGYSPPGSAIPSRRALPRASGMMPSATRSRIASGAAY